MDCMISPATLSPDAVRTIAIVRGSRLAKKIFHASELNFSRLETLTFLSAPISREKAKSAMNRSVRLSRFCPGVNSDFVFN